VRETIQLFARIRQTPRLGSTKPSLILVQRIEQVQGRNASIPWYPLVLFSL
jgi:hypothetical protein